MIFHVRTRIENRNDLAPRKKKEEKQKKETGKREKKRRRKTQEEEEGRGRKKGRRGYFLERRKCWGGVVLGLLCFLGLGCFLFWFVFLKCGELFWVCFMYICFWGRGRMGCGWEGVGIVLVVWIGVFRRVFVVCLSLCLCGRGRRWEDGGWVERRREGGESRS